MSTDPPTSVEAILPEGTAPPADIPAPLFEAAVARFLSGQRLDMQALAADLGIARSTLYRKAGDRDDLLGAVIWYLARLALVAALAETEDLAGVERVQAVISRFMHFVNGDPAFHRLLASEPEAALRILTSKQGFVQSSLVAGLERLLAAEEARGSMKLSIDLHSLAYVIVRIGESFLYADVIADNGSDLDLAVELVGRLLREHPEAASGP